MHESLSALQSARSKHWQAESPSQGGGAHLGSLTFQAPLLHCASMRVEPSAHWSYPQYCCPEPHASLEPQALPGSGTALGHGSGGGGLHDAGVAIHCPLRHCAMKSVQHGFWFG